MAKEVTLVGHLAFGSGNIGRTTALIGPEAEARFAAGLEANTRPLTHLKTADCGDERRTIRLASGVEDPDMLKVRVVWQLFGGLGIATTKAAVAAGANYLNEIKDFKQAYEKTVQVLTADPFNYEEGGHQGCGASGSVEGSVANAIVLSQLSPAVALFTGAFTSEELARQEGELRAMADRKKHLLEEGFYGEWDSAWHADFVSTKFPQNFSYLAEDPNDHETHGHHASGIYVVTREEEGFAKNAFIEQTGLEAFAVTLQAMKQIAHDLGTTSEERTRIELGFYDDTLHVGNGLIAPNMPVFA